MKSLITFALFVLLTGGLFVTGAQAEEQKRGPRVELCEECKVKVEEHRKEIRKKMGERRTTLANRLHRQHNRGNDEVRGPRHGKKGK
jgi:hypothetical protein